MTPRLVGILLLVALVMAVLAITGAATLLAWFGRLVDAWRPR